MKKNDYNFIIERISKHLYRRLFDIKMSGQDGETDFVLGENSGYNKCLEFIQNKTFVIKK